MTLQQALIRAEQLKQQKGCNLFGYPPIWIAMRIDGADWYSAIEVPVLGLAEDPSVWISYESPREGSKLCKLVRISDDDNDDWEVYDHRSIFPEFHAQMDRLTDGIDTHPIAADR